MSRKVAYITLLPIGIKELVEATNMILLKILVLFNILLRALRINPHL
jgi:hypothetical protein